MSGQGNLLARVVRRQTRFNDALKERVKSDKIKEDQLKSLRIKTIKKPKHTKGK